MIWSYNIKGNTNTKRMVPVLPVPFFDGADEPGFLLRSTIGTPGLPVDMICRMFRDHDFILEGFEVELPYIDWGE